MSYKSLSLFLFFGVLILSSVGARGEARACSPKLWQNEIKVWKLPSNSREELIVRLKKNTDKYLNQEPQPSVILGSAGKTSINDPDLKISRKAFQDSDHAAVFSLLFFLTNDVVYLNKAREILLAWAKVNRPTGNPIDETRLEGMVWAYDLIACNLAENDKTQIISWLEELRLKKLAWHFGPVSSANNHKIHQLKMLLLLDKALNHPEEWEQQVAAAESEALFNIDPKSGESVDYRERHSLHYHNYDLKAWLELSLITGCCQQSATQAFNFLIDHIRSHQIDGEFLNSEAKIDALRSKGGFSYARTGGTFDVREAAPTIVVYYTLAAAKPDSDLWELVQNAKPSPWLSFLLARRVIWQDGSSIHY